MKFVGPEAKMLIVTHSHPSVNEMDWEDDQVVSVYNGVRIPTGRHVKRRKIGDDPWGDLDPMNTKLQAALAETLDYSTLVNDELTYGIPRCDDGKFSVKAAWQAAHLPKTIKSRISRELYKRANRKMQDGLLGAVDSIVELATQPWVDERVRLDAAKYLFERLNGKTPDHVVHHQEKPWETVFTNIERGPRPDRQIEDGTIQDAEIVED